MTAPRTQTTRAKGLFITNATAPLLGAEVEDDEEDPVDEGPDEGPLDEVALMVLFPPRLIVLLGYPLGLVVVVPLEGAVVEVTMVLLLL